VYDLTRPQSNHVDPRAGINQPADLRFANVPGANHQATFAFEFQKHWEQVAHFFLGPTSLAITLNLPPH
jgi:hypothetical protein